MPPKVKEKGAATFRHEVESASIVFDPDDRSTNDGSDAQDIFDDDDCSTGKEIPSSSTTLPAKSTLNLQDLPNLYKWQQEFDEIVSTPLLTLLQSLESDQNDLPAMKPRMIDLYGFYNKDFLLYSRDPERYFREKKASQKAPEPYDVIDQLLAMHAAVKVTYDHCLKTKEEVRYRFEKLGETATVADLQKLAGRIHSHWIEILRSLDQCYSSTYVLDEHMKSSLKVQNPKFLNLYIENLINNYRQKIIDTFLKITTALIEFVNNHDGYFQLVFGNLPHLDREVVTLSPPQSDEESKSTEEKQKLRKEREKHEKEVAAFAKSNREKIGEDYQTAELEIQLQATEANIDFPASSARATTPPRPKGFFATLFGGDEQEEISPPLECSTPGSWGYNYVVMTTVGEFKHSLEKLNIEISRAQKSPIISDFKNLLTRLSEEIEQTKARMNKH